MLYYDYVISLEAYQETHGDVADGSVSVDQFVSSSFEVERLMKSLNKRQRIIVMLIYTGYKTHEIAKIINRSVSTVEKERMKIRCLIEEFFGRSV